MHIVRRSLRRSSVVVQEKSRLPLVRQRREIDLNIVTRLNLSIVCARIMLLFFSKCRMHQKWGKRD